MIHAGEICKVCGRGYMREKKITKLWAVLRCDNQKCRHAVFAEPENRERAHDEQ